MTNVKAHMSGDPVAVSRETRASDAFRLMGSPHPAPACRDAHWRERWRDSRAISRDRRARAGTS
jgi:hypothetical protein